MSDECKEADIDAVSRKKIIEEINQNFFVEAGAGSGKTTMRGSFIGAFRKS